MTPLFETKKQNNLINNLANFKQNKFHKMLCYLNLPQASKPLT